MIEGTRGNQVATRNQRLAALHTFYRYLALHHPDVFRAVASLSIMHGGRGPMAPTVGMRAQGITDFYWIYFQTPGVAEADGLRFVPALGQTESSLATLSCPRCRTMISIRFIAAH